VALNKLAMILLARCAEAMANDEEVILNLFPIRTILAQDQPAVVSYLAEKVQELSRGTRTVRQTMYAMLRSVPSGISCVYVVACNSVGAPLPPVTTFTGDMTPYVIAPGTSLGCTKAEPLR